MSPVLGRFGASLIEGGHVAHGDRVVVAVSGGLDSCVLLHLLRFAARPPSLDLVVAHFDHGMRGSSADDALWVGGLCRAWGVAVRFGRADAVLRSEEAARNARYEFLEAVRLEVGGRLVLTGHHADDQAETVLFRLLRGTGVRGLGGIPVTREPAVFRPLLGFWREELEAYAQSARLSWREDPSNREVQYARNALRMRVLPDVERLVASGARRALVRLARLAREDEAGWESLLPELLRPLGLEEEDGRISVDRGELMRLHPAVRARVLRALVGRLGLTLDEVGTRLAVEFASSGSSGGGIDLGRSVALRRELDRLVLGARIPVAADRPLSIPDVGPGSGEVVLGGRTIPVAWGGEEAAARLSAERFYVAALRFPLLVRSRGPGDRIRLPGGTKKVKKLLLEARIPPGLRPQVPVVVDAEGEVLWIPRVACVERGPQSDVRATLRIGIG